MLIDKWLGALWDLILHYTAIAMRAFRRSVVS